MAASLWHRHVGGLHQRMVKVRIYMAYFVMIVKLFASSRITPRNIPHRGSGLYVSVVERNCICSIIIAETIYLCERFYFVQTASAFSSVGSKVHPDTYDIDCYRLCVSSRASLQWQASVPLYPIQAVADLRLGATVSGYWPSTGSLLLLKVAVQIFPSTDFRCVSCDCRSVHGES